MRTDKKLCYFQSLGEKTTTWWGVSFSKCFNLLANVCFLSHSPTSRKDTYNFSQPYYFYYEKEKYLVWTPRSKHYSPVQCIVYFGPPLKRPGGSLPYIFMVKIGPTALQTNSNSKNMYSKIKRKKKQSRTISYLKQNCQMSVIANPIILQQ